MTYSTGENGKLFVSLMLPSQMSILTEPGVVHVLKIRIVRFVFYFIPLFLALHFLMKTAFQNKYANVSMISDFPRHLTQPNNAY